MHRFCISNLCLKKKSRDKPPMHETCTLYLYIVGVHFHIIMLIAFQQKDILEAAMLANEFCAESIKVNVLWGTVWDETLIDNYFLRRNTVSYNVDKMQRNRGDIEKCRGKKDDRRKKHKNKNYS